MSDTSYEIGSIRSEEDVRAVYDLLVKTKKAVGHHTEISAVYLVTSFRSDAFFGFTARVNDEIVGLIVGYYHFSCVLGGKIAHIEDLYVVEEHQRQGLGRRIVQRFRDNAKENGCCLVTFDMLASNPARAFYHRIGAKERTNVIHQVLPPLDYPEEVDSDESMRLVLPDDYVNVANYCVEFYDQLCVEDLVDNFVSETLRGLLLESNDKIVAVLLYSVGFSTFAGRMIRLGEFCSSDDDVTLATKLVGFLIENVARPRDLRGLHSYSGRSDALNECMEELHALNLTETENGSSWILEV